MGRGPPPQAHFVGLYRRAPNLALKIHGRERSRPFSFRYFAVKMALGLPPKAYCFRLSGSAQNLPQLGMPGSM